MKRIVSIILSLILIIISIACVNAVTEPEFNNKLNSLRNQYPDYSTWYGSFDGGTQCYGFARLIAYEVFGSYASGWSVDYSIDGVKPGDVLQYGPTTGSGHTVFVTSVSGDTIAFVDCNGNGNYSGGTKVRTCGIKWDNTISKSGKMYGRINFSYRLVSPSLSSDFVDLGTDFYAYIINTEPWKHLTNENLNVVMNSETGEANQVWFFERHGDGSYKISNCEDNRALDVHNFGTTDGTNVAVCESNDSTAQRWFITGESGAYFFKAACGDLVLDIEGGSLNDGANVQMWTRNDSTAQKFQVWKLNKPGSASVNCSPGTRYTPTSIYWSETSDTKCYDVKIWNGTYWVGDAYEIVWGINDTGCMINLPPGYYEAYVDSRNNYSSSMSENVIKFTVADNDSPVDVGNNIYASLLLNEPWLSIANVDGNVQLENSEYKMNKRIWNLQKQSDGSYIIENCYDGKVLTADASGISTSKVTVSENTSSDAQKWYIYGRWSGEYYLRPKCSDKVLDVKNGVNSVGAELQLYDLNYSAAQKFAIYTVDPSVVEPECLSGDTNNDGTVNMKDIVLLQQHLNNWDVELDLDASDVNDDDVVNMKDIVLLQQYLNGWDVELI